MDHPPMSDQTLLQQATSVLEWGRLVELLDLSIVLGLAAEVSRFLERRRQQAPALRAEAGPLEACQTLQPVKAALDRCVDPEGNIRESATPDLRRLTQQAQDLKHRMRD